MKSQIQVLFLTLILLAFQARNAVEGKICVATEENRYLCTDDAAKANVYRDQHNSRTSTSPLNLDISELGVEQTISGTPQEVEKVEKVLAKMEDYFVQEVYAKPEYKSVRGKW